MKRSTLFALGLVIALLGGAGLALERIPYDRDQATVDLGSVEASATVQEEAEIPPLLAGAVLALGVGIVAYGLTRG